MSFSYFVLYKCKQLGESKIKNWNKNEAQPFIMIMKLLKRDYRFTTKGCFVKIACGKNENSGFCIIFKTCRQLLHAGCLQRGPTICKNLMNREAANLSPPFVLHCIAGIELIFFLGFRIISSSFFFFFLFSKRIFLLLWEYLFSPS